mmetsp:Transcript_20612/g.26067  ORF Transcript_20612/g.26067 Transcript_20612/m.26067 type:complete len:269 (-) Transcript_20612:37-843(-)
MIKFLFVCSLLIAATYASQNQIFAWSNSHITGNNVQKLETIYSSDVTALLQSALGAEQNAFSQYFSSEAPQVSVLFLADSKPTQMPSLQNVLSSFKGHVAMPYGNFTAAVNSTIASFANHQQNVFVVGDFSVQGATVLNMKEALEHVRESSEQSLVIVDIGGNKKVADEAIVAFSELISNKQSSIALLMDISATRTEVQLPKSQKGFIGMKQVLEYGEASPYDTRFPAYIIEALLIAFLLAFIAIVGVVCTCQLQSPEGFETPHKHRD